MVAVLSLTADAVESAADVTFYRDDFFPAALRSFAGWRGIDPSWFKHFMSESSWRSQKRIVIRRTSSLSEDFVSPLYRGLVYWAFHLKSFASTVLLAN